MSSSEQQLDQIYQASSRLKKVHPTNIWVEITDLSHEYQAVDLSEGFANYMSYKPITKHVQAIADENDWKMYQYTRHEGHLRLVNAIAKHYSKHLSREIDPIHEVLITVGAYGSLHNAFSALVNKDDEVILIEPFYDCYEPMTLIAGGTPVYVPLTYHCCEKEQTSIITSDEWKLNEKDLRAAFNSKTKLIVFNTPNNPLGKVYTKEEMSLIAELCVEYNVICLSDEVYEDITYDKAHLRIASFPGMWERTLTIGSAGKKFSSTGVKTGWTIGPKELVSLCASCNSIEVNVCPTLFQEAIARSFETEEAADVDQCYFKTIKQELRRKRDWLAEQLTEIGFEPLVPDGGYFMLVDISKLAHEHKFASDSKECKDHKFVKYMIKKHKLAMIPVSSFYSDDHKKCGENLVRLCFFKDEETLKMAVHILKHLKMD